MKKTINSNSFTRVSQKLRRSPSLTAEEKLVIAYVLGWQKAGKECTASNPTVAAEHGISTTTLWRIITKLNKKPFFQSKAWPSKTGTGGHFNRKRMVVFEDLLDAYLESEATFQTQQQQKQEVVSENAAAPQGVTADQMCRNQREEHFQEEACLNLENRVQELEGTTASMLVTGKGHLLVEPENGLPKVMAIETLGDLLEQCIRDSDAPLLAAPIAEIEITLHAKVMDQNQLAPSERIKLLDWMEFFREEVIIPYINETQQPQNLV